MTAAFEKSRDESDELAEEMLDPYRALVAQGDPSAPVVRAILANLSPREALRKLGEVDAAWPTSLYAALQDLARLPDANTARGLILPQEHRIVYFNHTKRVIFSAKARTFPPSFPNGQSLKQLQVRLHLIV